MEFVSRLKNLFIDFLFPKSLRSIELEAFSVGEILDMCPQATEIKEKNILAIFDYAHPVTKELIWEVKYRGNKILAEKMAAILYNVIKQEMLEMMIFKSILLVPIPISDKRREERGWNQAELIAENLAALDTQNLFKYLPRELVKVRHTESQTKTSSRKERMENLVKSMKFLNAQAVTGKCVILVDDVTTTGSTFAEARRALREAGAGKILCIAVEH